ncbi:MAG: hypothetical protein ABMA64_13705 [Myxococcota bacterium]
MWTLWLGCTGPVPVSSVAEDGPTWADVAPDLVGCVGCHDRAGLAFPLTTWREAAPQADRVASAVTAHRMPPWPAGPADLTYLDDPSLDPTAIGRLTTWAAAGAPLGDADPDAALVPERVSHLPEVDATLRMEAPYEPLGDEHRCFVLERSALVERYVTGVEITPSNLAVAHHLLLTAIVPDDPANDPLTADALDPGPGFDCSVITLAAFPGQTKVLGGWLPGRGAAVFPDAAGIDVPPEAQIVLESHYFAAAPSGADQTTVALSTAASVRAPAGEIKVTHPDWGLHLGVAAPAGEVVTQKMKTTVEHEAGTVIDASGGLVAYWVLPHMHAYGVAISLEVVRDGEHTVLVDIPAWDYDWQLTYWFTDPFLLLPDDELRLSCTFDNPTATDVWWGESTDDEMCVARLFVAPP